MPGPRSTEPATNLTGREREVLTLLALGRPPREIAAELVISQKTVSSHLQRVLGKLNVNSRAQAVAVAYRDGLIEPPVEAAPQTGTRMLRRRRTDRRLTPTA